MTGNVNFVRHRYKVMNELKHYSVFELTSPDNGKVLTDLIRIEKDRHYHNGNGFNYWLRIRDTTNWQKCKIITGLKFTHKKNIFYGDMISGKCKNLLVFRFSENREQLIIDFYPRFYPNLHEIEVLIKKCY